MGLYSEVYGITFRAYYELDAWVSCAVVSCLDDCCPRFRHSDRDRHVFSPKQVRFIIFSLNQDFPRILCGYSFSRQVTKCKKIALACCGSYCFNYFSINVFGHKELVYY